MNVYADCIVVLKTSLCLTILVLLAYSYRHNLNSIPLALMLVHMISLTPNQVSSSFHKNGLSEACLLSLQETKARLMFNSNFFVCSVMFNCFMMFATVDSKWALRLLVSLTYIFGIIKIGLDQNYLMQDIPASNIFLLLIASTLLVGFFVYFGSKINDLQVSQVSKTQIISKKYSRVLDTIQEAIFVVKNEELEFINQVGLGILEELRDVEENQSALSILKDSNFFIHQNNIEDEELAKKTGRIGQRLKL